MRIKLNISNLIVLNAIIEFSYSAGVFDILIFYKTSCHPQNLLLQAQTEIFS